ncbi:MAG TPA: hypothetical protein VFT02_02130, partial [Pyrinomonadaceae bacterium]|nr:hypothetical protein [Pyrinomonadaceae bacterium]
MIRRSLIACFVLFAFVLAGAIMAQETQPAAADRVVGEITAVDAANKQLTLKTSAGKSFSVKTDDKTSYRRVPPGETTMERATTIAFTDIAVGDKTIARGRVEADKVAAQSLIVVSGREIAQKQEQTQEEWKKRGIKGTIVGINPGTKGLMVRMMTPTGPAPIRINTEKTARFLRYGPDAVTLSDAKPSKFDELEFGDSIRALGNKSEDGRTFFAEEIITGSFQMVGGLITEVNKETGEIKITDIKTKQPFTVVVRPDSKVRRLPSSLLKQMEETMANAPSPGAGGGGMRIIRPGETPPSAPQQPSPGGRPGGGAGGPSSGQVDYGEAIEKLPAIKVADLKPGEGIIVSSTKGADPARATAILLAAGVES